MSFRHLLASAVLLGCSFTTAFSAPLDFRVGTFVDSGNEGPDRERPFFKMERKRISFKQTQLTEVSSTPGQLTLHLAKPGTSGQISVTNSQFSPGDDFVSRPEPYVAAGEAMLPKGAENVEFKGADYKMYEVNGRRGVALDWTYTLYGRNAHLQIAYVNLDDQHQVCLTTLCEEESWVFANSVARRFMNSWYVVEDVKGPFEKGPETTAKLQ